MKRSLFQGLRGVLDGVMQPLYDHVTDLIYMVYDPPVAKEYNSSCNLIMTSASSIGYEPGQFQSLSLLDFMNKSYRVHRLSGFFNEPGYSAFHAVFSPIHDNVGFLGYIRDPIQ